MIHHQSPYLFKKTSLIKVKSVPPAVFKFQVKIKYGDRCSPMFTQIMLYKLQCKDCELS